MDGRHNAASYRFGLGNHIFNRTAGDRLTAPNTFNAVRFTVAALFLLVILLIRNRRQLTEFRGPIIRAGIILGFWLCLGYALQTVGLLYTTPSKAGFITGLSVVLVPLFSFLLLRDRIKVVAVIGVILAAAGLYLLTQNQEFSFNLGDALVFGCAICFAMQIVFTGKYAPRFSALPLAIVQLGTVAVMSWLYAFSSKTGAVRLIRRSCSSPKWQWA